ncbi:hypothetical protein OC834_002367 [Tilletia horrida]|nr:hypothetical protein OC834_002367 [Tilletia horrida]
MPASTTSNYHLLKDLNQLPAASSSSSAAAAAGRHDDRTEHSLGCGSNPTASTAIASSSSSASAHHRHHHFHPSSTSAPAPAPLAHAHADADAEHTMPALTQTATATLIEEDGTSSDDSQSSTAPAAAAAAAASSSSTALISVPPVPNNSRKLCLRHQRMADENTTAKLQKSIESLPLADQTAVNNVWTIFSSSPHPRRALILQGLLTMCCFSQLSLLSEELALAIRIDPFSLFPREVSLKVLGYLDASSLGRAAQVSRLWRSLADDDILWRNMCMQHIERKCEKCGWGLPLLKDGGRRRKTAKTGALSLVGTSPKMLTAALNGASSSSAALSVGNAATASSSAPSSSAAAAAAASTNAAGPSGTGAGSLKRTITAAANAAAQERHRAAGSTTTSPALHPQAAIVEVEEIDIDAPPSKRQKVGKSSSEDEDPQKDAVSATAAAKAAVAARAAAAPLTRPWKSVYCERLKIERNWRKCRYTTRVLSGHEDGIMCLGYNDHLSHPQFPVLITGSYDRTARVWNLETGEQLHVLRGHTRVVRCLQFDDCKLITGSMDRTLKIWNWRTGELMRTLEGHTEGILCLNFNEEILASGSLDSSIKIWNFRTGQCYTLRGHTDWVNNVLLWSGTASTKKERASSDATSWGERPMRSTPTPTVIGLEEDHETAPKHFLFSASDDGTIRLWDLGLRECILVFEGHVGQVQSLKLIHLDDDTIRKLTRNALGGPGAEEAERRRQELVAAQHAQHQPGAAAAGAAQGGAVPDVFPLPTPTSMLPAHSSQGGRGPHSSGSNGQEQQQQQHDQSDSYFHLRPHESNSNPYGAASSSSSAMAGAAGSGSSSRNTGGGAGPSGSGTDEGSGCPILPTTPVLAHNPTRSRSGSGAPLAASGLVLRHSPSLGVGPSSSLAGRSSSSAPTAAAAAAPTFPTPLSDPARVSSANRAHVAEPLAGGSGAQRAGVLFDAGGSVDFVHQDHGLGLGVGGGLEHGTHHPRHRALDPVLAHVQQRLEGAGLVPALPLDAEMGDIEGPLSEALDESDLVQQQRSAGAGAGGGYMRLSNAAILGTGRARAGPSASSTSYPSLSQSSSAHMNLNGSTSPNVHYAASSGARSPGPPHHRGSAKTSSSSSTAAAAAAAAAAANATSRPVLVSGSLDNTIKLWDVRTGRCLRTFFGHVQGVWSLDADKLRIISASLDRTIKIWDRETGFCQNTLVGHRGAVTCVALGDDKIVSGSDDNDVRVWSFADP